MQKCSLLQLCPLLQLCQLCFVVSVVHKKKDSLTCRSLCYLYTCCQITFINNVFASTGAQSTDKSAPSLPNNRMDGEWPHNGRTLAAAQKQRKKRTTHHKQHHENGRRMAAEWSQMVVTQNVETNTNTNRKKTTEPTICGFRTKTT